MAYGVRDSAPKLGSAPTNVHRTGIISATLASKPVIQDRPVKNTQRIANSIFLLGLMALVTGCLVGPREGYYDSDHHRYYHENGWHDCGERDEHCH